MSPTSWRTSDGRLLNRRVGPVRPVGSGDGLTRAQAEREFRRMQDAEEQRPSPRRGPGTPTVGDVADSLRTQLEEIRRRGYAQTL